MRSRPAAAGMAHPKLGGFEQHALAARRRPTQRGLAPAAGFALAAAASLGAPWPEAVVTPASAITGHPSCVSLSLLIKTPVLLDQG